MAKGYSTDIKSDKSARARGYELDISPKKAYEVCNALRGMHISKAERYLKDVIDMKRPVPIRRYSQETAHKKGGVGPGRYPVKAASYILKVLQEAKANAEFRGLDQDEMKIVHIAANRGRVIQGRMPRAHGRSTEWNEQTTSIEVVLEEVKGA